MSQPFPYAAACFHRHSLLVCILARRPLALILSLFLCSIIAVFVSCLSVCFVLFSFVLFGCFVVLFVVVLLFVAAVVVEATRVFVVIFVLRISSAN